MDERTELLNRIYAGGTEETRLQRSRHGQLELFTTMHYIHRLAPKAARILEIGAGTGRYAVALAKEGYSVTAIEPVGDNFARLRENGAGVENLRPIFGDALDLGELSDDSFDMTLLLGPMYHLYDEADRTRAIDEAIRVTKPGGILMAAFLSVHAILYDNYLQGNLRAGLSENFREDGSTRHFLEQAFTGYDVTEFEALFLAKPITRLATVATDGILELAEGRGDFVLSDEDFAAFSAHHLQTCEKRELLGSSAHLLYIGKKNA